MRHRNHRHQLGVKKEHREALVATLAASLFLHGRIKTTLAKARALRPYAEKIITMAKHAASTEDAAKKLHYRRLAIARVRNLDAVKKLFDERATEFANRQGGYTRIYKIGTRVGDAAEMALIELIDASDEGYTKSRAKPSSKAGAKKPAAKVEEAKAETPVADAEVATAEEAPAAEEQAEAEPKPAKKAAKAKEASEEEAKDA